MLAIHSTEMSKRPGDIEASSTQQIPKRQMQTHHEAKKSRIQFDRDRYTIAWICSNPIELAVAQGMLDAEHDAIRIDEGPLCVPGRIGQHDVVVCLSARQDATELSNCVAKNFPSIRLSLMVGFAGGVPNPTDMRLGDVVVGTKVVGYGRHTFHLDQLFDTAMSALKQKHELGPSRIPSIITEKLGGYYVNHDRPNSSDDLFVAGYRHMAQKPDCVGCNEVYLVPRQERESHDPKIHYGAIALVDDRVANGGQRDRIAKDLGAICFQTGNHPPHCLLIRGICDYSDSHQGEEAWQRYAAATAAAYAKELLEEIPRQNSLHDPLDQLKYEQINTRRREIESPFGSCEWFLNHPDYQAWLDPEQLMEHRGFLWICGKPGAGKSAVIKFLYEETHREHVVTSFFFNAKGGELAKSISGMYRSLLLQLVEGYPDLRTILEDLVLRGNRNGGLSLDDLRSLFKNTVSTLGKRPFTCFIDALDECEQVRILIQDLKDLADIYPKTGVELRFCCSSRHRSEIIEQQGIQLTLEDQPNHAEALETYIKKRLHINPPKLAQELGSKILKKAEWDFRWLVVAIRTVNSVHDRGRLHLNGGPEVLLSSLAEQRST
ncbi:hypothetical protein TWF481_002612 [Arthrobotrys musiformis]|uniref:Nephrocystin 3-like N-terminal domain-containing protein n=1 Tax=Arthrobotrys musiformis TaxID=47236 RepID=A0AAV9VQU9_9PEZI